MANDSTGSRRRTRLTKAEIKAYEARRAAERRRLGVQDNESKESDAPIVHSYTMTRDDEFLVIRSDLIRLGWIVAVLTVLLAIATILLS